MKKTNTFGYLAALTVLVLAVFLGGTQLLERASASLTTDTANEISSLYLREISSATGKHLQSAIEYHFSQVDSVASLLREEVAADDERLADYIGRMKETYGFTFLAFVDEEGYYHDGTGAFSAASKVSFLGSLLQGKTRLISYNEKIQNNDVILMGSPMGPIAVGDTSWVAVLAGLDTKTMSSTMALANERSQIYSSIVTADGTYVALNAMRDQFQGSNLISVLRRSAAFNRQGELEEIAKGLTEGGEGTHFMTMNTGEAFYLYYAPLEHTEWYLVTLMPYEVIEGTIRSLGSTINRNSMAALFIFLATLFLGFVLYIRMSGRKQRQLALAKEAAEQAFQIAEEANRAKSVFLSNMSHDIRTPMNAVVGFAALLDKDADNPDKVREYAKKITVSSKHLLGLINDVLDMAKIESGKTSLNVVRTSLADLIEDINTIIRPQMKAKKHYFDIRIQNVRHEMIYVDKLRIHQILLNLLSNAIKYTPEGGHIALELTELQQISGQYAKYRFRVSDNGYGIESEYLNSIFEVFTRERNSVINKIQGVGLGLAITKNLVNLMGGTIRVESEKGRGSIFTVELELMIAEDTHADEFWKNHNITRILVVDDEEDVCRNVGWTMEKLGVSVDYSLEGKTAVRMVEEAEWECRQYHTILLDWKMPGKDGIEVAKDIRRLIPENVSIMILTSYDYSEIEDQLPEGVIDGFISKPFFESSLRYKLQEILDKAEKAKPEDKAEGALRGRHVLVAEDNELNAEILGDLLDMVGATCQIFENGKLAYEAFESSPENQYQLILMDVQMPVMDGYEATRLIRESNHPQAKTIPIIAMTANAFAEDVQNALDAGMNVHMAKPVDIKMLERTVGGLL